MRVTVCSLIAALVLVSGPIARGHWGYPANAHYIVGVLEILGGLGVLIPKWRRAAAATLVGLMIGALGRTR